MCVSILLASPARAADDGRCRMLEEPLKLGDPRPSCSAGTRSRGTLLHGIRIPDTGCGYRRIFPHRAQAWGSDELVHALLRAARELDSEVFSHNLSGGVRPSLGVGNLGPPAGEEMQEDPYLGKRFSVSHGSGRAADLAFFILDRSGHSVTPNETAVGYRMDGFNTSGWRRIYLRGHSEPRLPERCRKGKTYDGITEWKCFEPAGAYRLDDERNWALARALLLDPEIGVIDPPTGRVRPRDRGIRRILVSNGIRERLLEEARRQGEPARFVALAEAVMTQPGNAPPHDDHLHVDLNCTVGDIRGCGCRNAGIPPRPFEGEVLRIPRTPRGTASDRSGQHARNLVRDRAGEQQ